jgi:hypothetical protein
MNNSKALAITGPAKKAEAEDANAEKVDKPAEKMTPPVEVLHVHAALLLAAESTALADEKDDRHHIKGVHLHRKDKTGRIVSTDGARVFLASFPIEGTAPSWLKSGITLWGKDLRKRVLMIQSMQDDPMIKLSHAKGSGFVEMSDRSGDAVFKIGRIARDYPDYEPLIGPASFFSQMDEDGNITNLDWQPIGINSLYLKHCGEIANTLNKGLPKEQRTKTGMIIRAFSSSPEAPMIFDFSTWPGALLIVLPARIADVKVSKETAALIGPHITQATKLTLAALRAHVTRQLAWAEAATDPAAAAEHRRKAEGFQTRIAAIIARTTGTVSIAAEPEAKGPASEPTPEPTPEPEPTWEPTPEPDPDSEAANAEQDEADATRMSADPEPEPDDEPEPEPDPASRPKARRTKIKVNRSAA